MDDDRSGRQAPGQALPAGTHAQDPSGSRTWPEEAEQGRERPPEPRPPTLWDRFLQILGVVGPDKRGGPGA